MSDEVTEHARELFRAINVFEDRIDYIRATQKGIKGESAFRRAERKALELALPLLKKELSRLKHEKP